MLNNDFFFIRSLDNIEENIIADIQLNPDHEIFKGHFPEQPVVPGVCQVQIIKEITELALKKNLQLKTADHIKFLSVIIPDKNAFIRADIKYSSEESGISVTASLTKEEKICLKLKGVFVEQQ